MPKSHTTFVPPLALTTFLTIVSDVAWSELVIVQVAASPLLRTTEPAVAVPTTVPEVPVQLQVPSVYPVTAFSSSVLVPALKPVSVVAVYVVVVPLTDTAP